MNPERFNSPVTAAYTIPYQGKECEVTRRDEIIDIDSTDPVIFHREVYMRSALKKVSLSKKTHYEDDVLKEVYTGEIVIEDSHAGFAGMYPRLIEKFNREIDESNPEYEGLAIHRSGADDIIYAVSHDGINFGISLDKSLDSKAIIINFGNIVINTGDGGKEIVDYPTDEYVDEGDALDNFLKLYIHVNETASSLAFPDNIANKKYKIGKPMTVSEEVYGHMIKEIFPASGDIEPDNLSTLPGIDIDVLSSLERFMGKEGTGPESVTEYSRGMILTGPSIDRAEEIAEAFSVSVGEYIGRSALYRQVAGADIRGRSSRETESKAEALFEDLFDHDGPAVLLVNDLESAYRHQNGRAYGIRAFRKTLGHSLYKKPDLFVFGTATNLDEISRDVREDTEVFTAVKIPYPTAKQIGEILISETVKNGILDYLAEVPSGTNIAAGVDFAGLGKEACGLTRSDLSAITAEVVQYCRGLRQKKNAETNKMQEIFESAIEAKKEQKS